MGFRVEVLGFRIQGLGVELPSLLGSIHAK